MEVSERPGHWCDSGPRVSITSNRAGLSCFAAESSEPFHYFFQFQLPDVPFNQDPICFLIEYIKLNQSYAATLLRAKRTCARILSNYALYWRLDLHKPAMTMI
jgi:hypothetical protein